jgi:hypothetical protein
VFDDEANGNDTSNDTLDNQPSADSAPTRNTARRTAPPPAMAFMAPPTESGVRPPLRYGGSGDSEFACRARWAAA